MKSANKDKDGRLPMQIILTPFDPVAFFRDIGITWRACQQLQINCAVSEETPIVLGEPEISDAPA